MQPPAQLFTTTLYDRHQPQQLSFVFIPARSLANLQFLDLNAVKDLIDPNASWFSTIPPSYLPAALASLLSFPGQSNPFPWWHGHLPPAGTVWIDPNSLGFAEYVAFSEVLPFEESPLRSISPMAAAVSAGATIGLIAGGATPFVLLTVPVGIILCTAGVTFGPALGDKMSKLIGA
jgi:hypothetical protein